MQEGHTLYIEKNGLSIKKKINSYFLGLERNRHLKKISKLERDDGELISNQ